MIDKRQDILTAANRVFYGEGFHDVGIDRLAAEAHVALGTVYRHFKGRADIIVGAMDTRQEAFLALSAKGSDRLSGAQAVLRLFDDLETWNERHGRNGCLFLRAAADHPADEQIRAAALRHKQAYLFLIDERLRQGGWSQNEARTLSQPIFLLLEGAVAAQFTLGDKTAIATARRIAEAVLRDAAPEKA